MNVIWTKNGAFRRVEYDGEADLESAILQVQEELFGPERVYLDIKRKIGARGGVQNIPDGYMLDLSGSAPRLYVVENELSTHELLKHIAVQILEFSLSFESERRTVKNVIFNALQSQAAAKEKCEEYAKTHGYRNVDHLLEHLVYETPFAALVIIDEVPDVLESALAEKFHFSVEVLELARFVSQSGDHVYGFEPFLADVAHDVALKGSSSTAEPRGHRVEDVDTIVVPAQEDGFRDTFLSENRWYAIRIHASMRPQIKYIAAYRVAPVSAVTHLAPVKSIEPWPQEPGYWVVNFLEPAHEIGPIPLVKGGRVRQLQSLRYTTRERLEKAKSLEDVW